jgi:hypothetical protein
MDRRKSRGAASAASPSSYLHVDPLSSPAAMHSPSKSSRRPTPAVPIPLTCPSKLELSATYAFVESHPQLLSCSLLLRSLGDLLRQCFHAFGRCSGVAASATLLYSLFRSRKMLSKHPLLCLLLALPQVRAGVRHNRSRPTVNHFFTPLADIEERPFSRIFLFSLRCTPLPPPAASWRQARFSFPTNFEISF